MDTNLDKLALAGLDQITHYRTYLRNLQAQLRAWAAECVTGGWSTNLVVRLRGEADRIDELLVGMPDAAQLTQQCRE